MANSTVVRGPGMATLLAAAFIVMKLTGYLTWSWFWILSPLWISWGIVLFILFVAFLIASNS